MKKFRIRFDVTTYQASTPITFGDIATLLAMKSGSNGDSGIIMQWEAVRLKQVHLWGPAVTNTLNNTLGIEFVPQIATNSAPSNNQGFIEGVNTTRTNDSSTSNTGSSHVVKYPSGLAAKWINPATIMIPSMDTYNAAGLQPMFTITAPQFSVMDLVVECVWSDGSFPVVYISTSSTALNPGTYVLGLGFSAGSPKILAQDYNSYD
jgi:hypothetical protein